MSWFVDFFLSSFGLKRRLTALFQVLATVIGQVPGLAPYAAIFNQLASWLGLTAITHAAVVTATTEGDDKKAALKLSPLSTLASFFAALEIASKTVPALMPFEATIHLVAEFFAILATGSFISGGQG